jgi:hypothetical protein
MVSTTTADAQPSRLNIVGSVNVAEVGGGPNILLDFLNPVVAIPTVDGVFLPEIVPFVTTGTMNDVEVSAAGCANCPVSPLLTIGGYVFTLTSTPLAPAGPFNFGSVALAATATGTTASMAARGTVTGGDFGANVVPFEALFTAQFVGDSPFDVFNDIDTGGTRNVSFSAEFVVGVIPEPSTYALMATGLLGLVGAAAARRRLS